MHQDWTKADIVNHLACVRGYRRYLELCCDTTGWLYVKIDRTRLTDCRRLMYRRPEAFAADGLPIDYRSATLDIGACLDRIAAEGLAFDIILVDSWHEYETSRRDLDAAFQLIGPGGTLVVHDCLPRCTEIAGPDFVPGEWCGVTYQAYIDFVTARDDLAYCTVDVDYGCGVIRKLGAPTFLRGALGALAARLKPRKPEERAKAAAKANVLDAWREARAGNPMTCFAVFNANRQALLNLISLEEFLTREKVSSPGTARRQG